MDPLTIQYRLDLPSTLHPISPALSALHVSRAAALHPEISSILHPSHCLKCGAYRTLSTKKNRRRATSSRPKIIHKRCHLCGHLTLNHSVLPSDLSKTGSVTPAESHHPTNASATRAPVAPLPGQHTHPKSGHPKVSSLRDMLSRNRQREEGAKAHEKRKEGHDGLAAFLKEL